jgi:hypothetical protein
MFKKGNYRVKKHTREDPILPELLSDNLSNVSAKRTICERNKNCVTGKKYSESETGSEESDSNSTMWVKEDKTPNLGPFTEIQR